MKFEITLDMEALGEDDTILVRDEFGEYPDCEYVPKSMYDQLKAENERLRDYAYALEECRREAHYCEFCPHFHRNFEDENPHCDFDFDALRAAAGMEVDD